MFFKNPLLVLAVILKTACALKTYDHCLYSGKIALTFNDGPSLEYTEKILDILDKQDEIIKREHESGHIIGCHTYSYPVDISKLTNEQLKEDVNKLNDAIYDIISFRSAFFRPPHGEYNESILDILKKCKMRVNVIWNLDSEDWSEQSNLTEQCMKDPVLKIY